MKIGVLTGGGDSSAINAAIIAIVNEAAKNNFELRAIKKGWAGLVEGNFEPLTRETVKEAITTSGTLLGSSRTNPFKTNTVDKVIANFKKEGLDAIIAIGGDDTNGVLHKLHGIDEPIKGVGIPQTIDNDIEGTEYAIGFDTAVNVATDALDKLKATARSHHRVMVVEIMGRDAGHIALEAGVAGGAHVILVPEEDFDVEEICTFLKKRRDAGNIYSLVAIAEGTKIKGKGQITCAEKTDQFGHVMLGGVAKHLSEEIEERTGIESRYMILGHLQRGGTPTALDRFMSTRFGMEAIKAIKNGDFNKLIVVQDAKFKAIDLGEGLAKAKPVDMDLYHQVRMTN